MDLKCRQERLVFVDPEDEEISYWWPAIVVPEEEYELFKETMDNDAGVNVGEHERLVCYFEDGSFSVVPKSGLIPFNPQKEPYKSYSTRLKYFLTDAGVRRATEFHNTGKIPKMFKWLILSETGYLDPTIESEIEEGENSSMLIEEEIVEEVEGEEQATMTPITNYNTIIRSLSSGTIIKKPKISKEVTTSLVKNKRGRKPKNQNISENNSQSNLKNNPENKSEIIISPKPMNPSNMMKIEALISSKMSAESVTAITAET